MSGKKSKIITVLVIALGIALAYLVITLVMDLNGKINQGSCRFIDVVTTSTLDVEDNAEELESLEEANELKLKMSQRNAIDVVLAPFSNIKEVYITNMTVTTPEIIGDIVVYQDDPSKKQNVKDINEKYYINSKSESEDFNIKLNFDNEYLLKDVKVPDDKKYLKLDGTILKEYGILVEKIRFKVNFNLNVVDNVGKISTSKLEFEFPSEKFIDEGIDITQRSLEDFIFKVN